MARWAGEQAPRSRSTRGRGAYSPARWAPGKAYEAERPRVAVAAGLRSLEAGRRQKPGLPRGTGPGTGRHRGGGPAGSPGRTRPDSSSLRRSPFGSRAPSTSRPPAVLRQQASDGASPTFVRQVRHFTSLSPPTRPRARPPGSACFLRRLPAPAHSTSRRRGEEEGSSHRLALRSRACVLTVPRPPPLPARRRGRG